MKPPDPSAGLSTTRPTVLSLGSLVVLIIGLVISASVYLLGSHYQNERIRRDLARQVDVRHALFSGSLQSYQDALHSLRILFENSDDISWEEFQRAAKSIRNRYSSIQAIQWIPVVPNAQRAEVEAYARAHISPDYSIWENQAAPKVQPASPETAYCLPILYNYPLEENRAASGYNLMTSSTVLTIEQAETTGELALSAKLNLVQFQAGVVMVAPIQGAAPASGKKAVGFVQIVFRLQDMLEQFWTSSPVTVLDFIVVDTTDKTSAPTLLFSRMANGTPPSPEFKPSEFADELTAAHSLRIGGRVWTTYYRPSTAWLEQQQSEFPLLALASSLLLTLVGTAYVRTLGQRHQHIANEVASRTAELRHTQQLLENDISHRVRVETELQETSRLLSSILSQVPGMIYRCSNNGSNRMLFVNERSRELTAYSPEEIMHDGFNYLDLVHEDDRTRYRELVAQATSTRAPFEIEYRLHDKHGKIRWVLDRGVGVFGPDNSLLFIEGLAINIDDRRNAEAEKLQLERKLQEGRKLESLGVLAGGIAHDFNNLLTGILGHANLLRQDSLPSACIPLVDRIERSAIRAADLCQQMLAYSGRGRFSVETFHLEQIIGELFPLIESSISKSIRLHLDLAQPPVGVYVDRAQIHQIIMSLVINASDAIADHSGDITIKTGRQTVDKRYLQSCVLTPTLPIGEYAYLEVCDSGCGMDTETISKIFDPFFTTKFTGRGLGLPVVLGIIRGHEGALHVASQPGLGSTFRFILPIVGQPLANPQSAAPFPIAPPPTASANPSLSARILLVDDDEQVRLVGGQILKALGHTPTLAADGETAIRCFKQDPGSFDLVLLDRTMPGLNGDKVLRILRSINPTLPVLLMSGYSERDAIHGFNNQPGISFLQKPFNMNILRERIRIMLTPKSA